jgi:Predicted hydrolase (HAD superfamily)
MKKKYKILIFDLDDTLIDNLENVRYAFQIMVEKQNEIYTDEKFIKWYQIDNKFWKEWQDGLIELPEEFKSETGEKSDGFLNWLRAQRALIYFDYSITLEEAIDLNNLYMESLTEVVIPIEGAYETLKYLSDKYTIVIATNGPKIAAKEKLSKINCLEFTANVFSADMFGYMKPKIEFFEGLKKHYSDMELDDYIIIGDSIKSDIVFGMNCGIDSCWFNKKGESLSDNYEATIIITKLTELKDIL